MTLIDATTLWAATWLVVALVLALASWHLVVRNQRLQEELQRTLAECEFRKAFGAERDRLFVIDELTNKRARRERAPRPQ